MGILGGKKVEDVLSQADDLLDDTPHQPEPVKPAFGSVLPTPAIIEVEHEESTDAGTVQHGGGVDTDTYTGDGGVGAVPAGDTAAAPEVAETSVDNTLGSSGGVLSGGAGADIGDVVKTFTVGDLSAVTDLSQFAMKVTMKQSRWYGVKRDHKAEADVDSANNTKVRAGKFTKELLAGCDKELKDVHSAIDAARTTHYAMTRPWTIVSGEGEGRRRTGPRLLANADYFDYCENMAGHRTKVQEALDVFEPKYAELKEKAKENLGGLYNESDYPAVNSIREQFGLDFDFEPLPDGSSFQEGTLEATQASKLASHFNNRTKKMLENALQEVWDKLYRTVAHMVERLSDPDKTFHASMLENAQEVSKMLKHYNFTGDPRMDEMYRELEGRLLTADAKELRKDKDIRKSVAEDAKRVLAKLESYGLGS